MRCDNWQMWPMDGRRDVIVVQKLEECHPKNGGTFPKWQRHTAQVGGSALPNHGARRLKVVHDAQGGGTPCSRQRALLSLPNVLAYYAQAYHSQTSWPQAYRVDSVREAAGPFVCDGTRNRPCLTPYANGTWTQANVLCWPCTHMCAWCVELAWAGSFPRVFLLDFLSFSFIFSWDLF